MVFTGAFGVFGFATVLGVLGIVLSAAYILWTAQRSLFQTLPHRWEHLTDAVGVERVPLVVLMAVILLIGLFPAIVTDVIKAGIMPIVGRLG